jgi:hypothetical protein
VEPILIKRKRSNREVFGFIKKEKNVLLKWYKKKGENVKGE